LNSNAIDQLESFHLKNIERVYGNYAGVLIDALYHNPKATIPIILQRLQQKCEEWQHNKGQISTVQNEIKVE